MRATNIPDFLLGVAVALIVACLVDYIYQPTADHYMDCDVVVNTWVGMELVILAAQIIDESNLGDQLYPDGYTICTSDDFNEEPPR